MDAATYCTMASILYLFPDPPNDRLYCGTDQGFRVAQLSTLHTIYQRTNLGPIHIVECYRKSNILILVGDRRGRNTLIVWDDYQAKAIREIIILFIYKIFPL